MEFDLISNELIKISQSKIDFNNTIINANMNIKIAKNIFFSDDVWDFSEKNTLDKPPYFFIYDFSKIDSRYKFYFKKTILGKFIEKRNRFGSVHGDYSQINAFINFLQCHNIYNIELIDETLLKKYFKGKNLLERSVELHKSSLKSFFEEVEYCNKHIDFSRVFKQLNSIDKCKKKAEVEAGKTKCIPDEMFDLLVSLALVDLKEANISEKDQLIACLIIFLCESGIRVEEMQKIEVDKADTLKIDEEKEVNYLEFKTFKTQKNKTKGYEWTEMYLSDKAMLAYQKMTDISKQSRENAKSKYIYLYHEKKK